MSTGTEISYGSLFNIKHNIFNMKKIDARWLPRLLTIDQNRISKSRQFRVYGRYIVHFGLGSFFENRKTMPT